MGFFISSFSYCSSVGTAGRPEDACLCVETRAGPEALRQCRDSVLRWVGIARDYTRRPNGPTTKSPGGGVRRAGKALLRAELLCDGGAELLGLVGVSDSAHLARERVDQPLERARF